MQNTREIAEEYRLAHWAQVMRERTEFGMSIKAYCRQIGISGNTYFYWQKKLREAACEKMAAPPPAEPGENSLAAPAFTEVQLEAPPAQPTLTGTVKPSRISVEIKGAKITADSTYPPDKLAALCREFARSC